jgi:hypothetical protein
MLAKYGNYRVSMMSVTRSNFSDVERIVRSLGPERLEMARTQLEETGKTTDDDVNKLLRSLSLYGHPQPMSREQRLSMQWKIKSLIIRYGIPENWFTLNPNDITNPIKLRLAAYRCMNLGKQSGFPPAWICRTSEHGWLCRTPSVPHCFFQRGLHVLQTM